jgi:two-component system chemotaxis response regulator CheB
MNCGALDLIVVGASLGGLKALETLLPGLPAGLPLPLAVVVHRGRFGDDSLAEHLQKFSALALREVEDKDRRTPGRVFLAPADYHLLVEGDHFALSADGLVNHARPAIDVLFESAAEACGPRVLGIVLTGANDDGARGLAAIHARGGLTLVQDPATAESRAMPAAAVAAVPTATVLPLDRLAAWVCQHYEF